MSPEEELPPPPPPSSMPPPLPAVSQSPVQEAPDSPTSVQAASPTLSPRPKSPLPKFHSSAPPRLACLAPLKDAHALKCALLACAPDAHAAAADAIARLSALRDAREAEAAARSRKKKKRKRPKPLFDELAAAGVFLYPEIGAFDAAGGRGAGAHASRPLFSPAFFPSPCQRRRVFAHGSPNPCGGLINGRAGSTKLLAAPTPSPGAPRRPNVPCPRGPRPGGTAGSGADPSLDRDVSASQSSSQPTLAGFFRRRGVAVAERGVRGDDYIADSSLEDFCFRETSISLAVPDDLLVDRDGPRARYFSRRQRHFPQLAAVKRRQQLLRKVRAPQEPLAARAVADDYSSARRCRARWWWGDGWWIGWRRVRSVRVRGGATRWLRRSSRRR